MQAELAKEVCRHMANNDKALPPTKWYKNLIPLIKE